MTEKIVDGDTYIVLDRPDITMSKSRLLDSRGIKYLWKSNDSVLDGLMPWGVYAGDTLSFRNGKLHNYRENNGGVRAAFHVPPGHFEYWEDGQLHRDNDQPAVIADRQMWYEYWEHGTLLRIEYVKREGYNPLDEYKPDKIINFFDLKRCGSDAEFAFSRMLNKSVYFIPFLHIDQPAGDLYSKAFWQEEEQQKRPDYLIFIDKRPFFIDVKARKVHRYLINGTQELRFTVDQDDFDKLFSFQAAYTIPVYIAFVDIASKRIRSIHTLLFLT